ncbi:ABC transporter permease [Halalkalibacterium halodurans]|uniref:ABC3 transporter permease C-terminal domain-containing protein n=1 Tax=Halalkalibacterium halodurans TaxID=86665 RepID=A0A0M0KE67_ALKHA|nr:ABC transporter permease [Halalkalibacterium halodurans]MED4164109.1 ABC transporter permease [Halalkalibacterium halodurans]
MLRYSFRSIKRNFASSLLLVGALVAIFVASPLSFSMLSSIQAEVDANIKQYARGSYDLLIRPIGTQTAVETTLGVVEENYLALGEGGISLNEWETIKALDGVEVAAPVASLGYFAGETHTVAVEFPNNSSFIEGRFQTSDGLHTYPLQAGGSYYVLEQEGYYYGYEYVQQGNEEIPGSGGPPFFSMPVTYHLIVGIDQQEEEKLTGFNFSALNNSIPEGFRFYFDLDVERHIKIIYLKDATTPLTVQVDVAPIDWETADTERLKDELGLTYDEPLFISEQFPSLFAQFQDRHIGPIETYTFDLSEHMPPFSYDPVSLDYDGSMHEPIENAYGVSESSRFYQASPIDYDIQAGGRLKVKQVGDYEGIPIYRTIQEQGGAAYELHGIGKIPFLLYPVGHFTTAEYEHSLSASPLGIYQQAPSVLSDGTMLHETIAPGSFVNAPAHGLMALEDAAFIKGDAPIDAIRIRVAGITAYDQEAVDKMSEVATEIAKLGDYQIDVIAGASPAPMTMDVEGIGEVVQPWTSLGAAATIRDGWNGTNVLIAGLFLFVSISYLANRFHFRRHTKKEEQELLLDLGWKKRHIRWLYLMENSSLIFLSAAIASLILLTYIWLYQADWFILIFFVAVVVLTFLFSLIYVSMMRGVQKISFRRLKGQTVWIRNLFYYRRLLTLSIIQLASVALLLAFVVSSIAATIAQTGGTYLGVYINDAVFIPLVSVMVAALFLAVLTVGESTSAFLLLRKEELQTLRDIGWRIKDVHRLCLKESAFWTTGAIMGGVVISLLTVSVFYSLSLSLLLFAVVAVVLLSSIAIVTAGGMIRSSLRKMA